SCVTFPIAPCGVVSVSPVTRQATTESANERRTARALCHNGMPNEVLASQARATNETSWPITSQDPGVSIASISVNGWRLRENSFPMPRNALKAVRHCMKKLSSPEATMHDVPPQSVHCTQALNPEPVM